MKTAELIGSDVDKRYSITYLHDPYDYSLQASQMIRPENQAQSEIFDYFQYNPTSSLHDWCTSWQFKKKKFPIHDTPLQSTELKAANKIK